MFTDREIEEKTRNKWSSMSNEDAVNWMIEHGFDKLVVESLSMDNLQVAFLNAYASHLKSRDYTHSMDFNHDE